MVTHATRGRRPIPQDDAFTVGEDGTVSLAVLANDRGPTQSGRLTIVGITAPELFGAMTIADDGQSLLWHDVAGAFDFLAAGATLALRFNYTVQVSNGTTGTATVALTISGANDAPSAGPDQSVTVAEDLAHTATIATVAGSDPDQGAALSYSLTGGNAAGLFEIDNATGVISLASGQALDFETAAQHVLTVTVSDGSLSDTAQVTINVSDVPEATPLDLVTANLNIRTVSVRFGDGAGGFSGGTEVDVGPLPRSVALGNLDGDLDLDLVTANQFSDTVSVRLGDGMGGFAGGSEVAVGDGPFSVALGDIDGDGDLDFVAASAGSNTVSVRLGDGAGGFGGDTEVAVGDTPQSVALGDLNGDGELDFVTANRFSNTVSVRLGDGAGGFGGGTEIAVGDGAWSVALGDLDGAGGLTPAGLPDLGPLVPIPADPLF
jgi:VCBS repeat-containing protein